MPAGGNPPQIARVDGCKNGWIAVPAEPETLAKAQAKIFKSFAELISQLSPRTLIAIDIPIGLPERAIGGGREPDWVARAFLGPRRVSLFPVPSRRVVDAHEQGYEKVCKIAEDTSDPPKKPSQQVFNIFPRIREVDAILRQDPALRACVFEVHPEVSFKVMNNDEPLPSKKDRPGMQLRKELLMKEGFPLSFLDQSPPRGARWDDFYDACACAWSARRILYKEARIFPMNPPLDGEGLEQAIRA